MRQLTEADAEHTRYWPGVAIGVAFLAAGVWLARSADDGNWYLWPVAGFLVLFGVSGVGIYIGRAPRDERGRKIKR